MDVPMRTVNPSLCLISLCFCLLVFVSGKAVAGDSPSPSNPTDAAEPLPQPTRTDQSAFVGGVPLGGIGTGTVELRGDGSFREWQIFNDWGNSETVGLFKYLPTYDLLNSFAAVKIDDQAYVLETHPANGLPGVDGIAYDGRFPFADLHYHFKQGTPVEVTSEAFDSFVPHHPNDSGIPAIGMTYHFENVSTKPVKISLALSAVYPLGETCSQDTSAAFPVVQSARDGQGIAIAALDDTPVMISGGTDTVDTLNGFWKGFSSEQPHFESSGTGQRVAEVVSFQVLPHHEKSERFVLGWYFPDHRENGRGPLVGQRYEAWTSSPSQSVRLMASRFDTLRSESDAWRDTLMDSTWPDWVTNWLCNNQSTMAKNTWWTKDGRFMNYESTECPNGSPVHVLDLADWPVVDEFPELELRLLRQYASSQSPEGKIPEEFEHHGDPSITYPGGRDLADDNPKYAVEIYHRWRETGDRGFLDATYPAVKRCLIYEKKFDAMGVGLPSGPSYSSTWDHWNDAYLFSYSATVALAGWRAGEALAKIEGDTDFAAQAHQAYETGLASMNAHLWNGEFYGMTTDANLKQDDLCFVESTYGDVFSRLVGLGPVLPDDRSLSSLRAICKYDNEPTKWSLVVTADTKGKMVEYDGDVRAQITTCHAMPAPIGLIQEGDASDVQTGLRILKQMYDIGDLHPGGLWNLPHHVVAATGERNINDFSHYFRDRALWALLKALNGWSYDAPDRSLNIGPVLNPALSRGPWICSKGYGTLAQKITGTKQTDWLIAKDGALTLKSIIVRSRVGAAKSAEVTLNGKIIGNHVVAEGNQSRITFNAPMTVQSGQTLNILLQGNHIYSASLTN